PLELLVLAHVGRNHLADLPGFQQQAEAEAVDARVVGDGGQALDAGVPQGLDQRLGDAAQAEAADRQRLVVGDDAVEGGFSVGIELALGAGRGRRHGGLGHGTNSFLGGASLARLGADTNRTFGYYARRSTKSAACSSGPLAVVSSTNSGASGTS